MGLVFNKIRFEARGQSYLGAYYTTLGIDGVTAPLRMVAGPDTEISAFLRLSSSDLLLAGGSGSLITFDPGGCAPMEKII
jgi:hypothetical protein